MSFDFKKMLKKEGINVGLKEQKARYGAAAAAGLLSVFLGNVTLLLLSIALAATGFVRWCPAYAGLGRNTCDPNEPAPAACCGHGHEH